jgi:hypothetical protein
MDGAGSDRKGEQGLVRDRIRLFQHLNSPHPGIGGVRLPRDEEFARHCHAPIGKMRARTPMWKNARTRSSRTLATAFALTHFLIGGFVIVRRVLIAA